MRVWIRHCAGVRGVCEGEVTAFDKHFNLVSALRPQAVGLHVTCYNLCCRTGFEAYDRILNFETSAAPETHFTSNLKFMGG